MPAAVTLMRMLEELEIVHMRTLCPMASGSPSGAPQQALHTDGYTTASGRGILTCKQAQQHGSAAILHHTIHVLHQA
jgi:hypothetical protein